MPPYLTKQTIDVSLSGNHIDIPIGGFSHGAVQVTQRTSGATGATYTVKRSLTGESFLGFPRPVVLVASGVSGRLDLRGVAALRVEVTSADSTSGAQAELAVFAE